MLLNAQNLHIRLSNDSSSRTDKREDSRQLFLYPFSSSDSIPKFTSVEQAAKFAMRLQELHNN